MDELADLHEALGQDETVIAAIVGEAGVGKSHLAETFGWEWKRQKSDSRFVVWLKAETEEKLRQSYEKAIKQVRREPEEAPRPEKRQAKSITDWAMELHSTLIELADSFDWLLIFDNVPERVEDEEGFAGFRHWFFDMPALLEYWNQRGKVLFTSRHGFADEDMITDIRVRLLDKDSSVKMLLDKVPQRAHDDEDKVRLQRLASIFDHLPQHLYVCNGDLRRKIHRGVTIAEYVEQGSFDGVENAADELYRRSLEDAYDVGLGNLLDIAAYVSPDDIPIELFGKGEEVKAQVDTLEDWNLLRVRERDGSTLCSLHRLQQQAARRGRSTRPALEAVDQMLAKFNQRDTNTWSHARMTLPHVEALLENVMDWPSGYEESRARVLFNAGDIYFNVSGDYDAVTTGDLHWDASHPKSYALAAFWMPHVHFGQCHASG